MLVLTGPGGGTWTIAPGGEDGRVAVTEGAAGDAAATITSDAHDFVAWATRRRPWAECVTIEGDEPYASTVLDASPRLLTPWFWRHLTTVTVAVCRQNRTLRDRR